MTVVRSILIESARSKPNLAVIMDVLEDQQAVPSFVEDMETEPESCELAMEQEKDLQTFLDDLDGDTVVTPDLNPTETTSATPVRTLTGRLPQILYLSCDYRELSLFQQLIRKQMHVFEATETDVAVRMPGRNQPIHLGQVGLQCRHCAYLPLSQRGKGSTYFPAKLEGIYQMGQTIANVHLLETCPCIPPQVRETLVQAKTSDSNGTSGVGKQAWARRVEVLGVYEDEFGLRFKPSMLE